MLDCIVAATDLSASSIDAVERGFLIAQATGAHYTVLHAAGLDALAPIRELLGENIDAVRRKICDEAKAQLCEIVAEANFAENVTADIRVEDGRAAVVVPAFVAKAGAGLLLIGAHGHGFLHRILLGSTASILLRESKCPVLIVKQPPRHAYKRVLVAVDFSPASVAAITTARAVAPGAAMTLLHVFDLPFEGMMFYSGIDEALVERYARETRARAFARSPSRWGCRKPIASSRAATPRA
jgi:CPA2 family monovalent cation:H+ antiporter-2